MFREIGHNLGAEKYKQPGLPLSFSLFLSAVSLSLVAACLQPKKADYVPSISTQADSNQIKITISFGNCGFYPPYYYSSPNAEPQPQRNAYEVSLKTNPVFGVYTVRTMTKCARRSR